MYYCDECECEQPNDWCDDHKKLLRCNHRFQISTRIKDVIYGCEDGDKTVTLYINHCEICGLITDVDYS